MDNNHYRYCFSCEKWKTKSEINEVDLGDGNKTFNCNICRKDLGDPPQIFRCKKHNDEILKVWGTLEGINKEKIFFDKCPQEKKENQPTKSPIETNPLMIVFIVTLIVVGLIIVGILIAVIKDFLYKKRK